MADDELSRSSAGDDDFEEPEDDNGIDNEGTLDEEEALDNADDDGDELRDLEEEGEMSIEELRQKYGIPAGANTSHEDDQTAETSNVRNAYSLLNEEDDMEDDKDYIPSDPYKKEVRIDEQLYQAKIPELGEAESSHPVSEPLWIPTDALSDDVINNYIQNINSTRKEIGQYVDERLSKDRDDEDSLCALLRAGYDVNKAKASFPFPHVNKAIRSVRTEALEWDEKEKKHFEDAFASHGKDFALIRNNSSLSYRPTGELVDFYYRWKKTSRYKELRSIQQKKEEEYRQFATNFMASSNVKHNPTLIEQEAIPQV